MQTRMRDRDGPTFDDAFNQVVKRAPHHLREPLAEIFKRLPQERERARWEAAGIIAQANALEALGTPEDKAAAEGARAVAQFILERASTTR
ncbi:MAG: hypothetical protein KC619_24130 [Myxococcales bacterium]|nr:hypothetical protein [Myxococcales bacterium]